MFTYNAEGGIPKRKAKSIYSGMEAALQALRGKARQYE